MESRDFDDHTQKRKQPELQSAFAYDCHKGSCEYKDRGAKWAQIYSIRKVSNSLEGGSPKVSTQTEDFNQRRRGFLSQSLQKGISCLLPAHNRNRNGYSLSNSGVYGHRFFPQQSDSPCRSWKTENHLPVSKLDGAGESKEAIFHFDNGSLWVYGTDAFLPARFPPEKYSLLWTLRQCPSQESAGTWQTRLLLVLRDWKQFRKNTGILSWLWEGDELFDHLFIPGGQGISEYSKELCSSEGLFQTCARSVKFAGFRISNRFRFHFLLQICATGLTML